MTLIGGIVLAAAGVTMALVSVRSAPGPAKAGWAPWVVASPVTRTGSAPPAGVFLAGAGASF